MKNKIGIIFIIISIIVIVVSATLWLILSFENSEKIHKKKLNSQLENSTIINIELSNTYNEKSPSPDYERIQIFYDKDIDSAILYYTYNYQDMIVDRALTKNQFDRISELIKQYNSTVAKESESYWPHTSEYPAMLTLFEYRIDFRPPDSKYLETIKYDGAVRKPTGYDDFIKEVVYVIMESRENE